MKSKSYIPSYNARLKLTQRNVKTPEKIIKTRKSIKNKLSNIKYFIDNDTQEIYNIDSDKNKVEKLLIKNLKQNRKIKIKNIRPPKQCGNNCWFNVLFMCYFISDKGRKFTKPVRLSMIKGDFDKSMVKKANYDSLTKSLFMFNLGIEGALYGSSFSDNMNTNEIITSIYNSIITPETWTYHKGYGNPLAYYNGLIDFLYSKSEYPITFYHITPYILSLDVYTGLEFGLATLDKFPHVIIVEMVDNQSTIISTRKPSITLSKTGSNETTKYILDSVCMRDVNQTHVGCLITLNKTGYIFDADGPLKKRMKPLNWNNESFLNEDKTFSLGNNYSKFNMRKGYQILYYYRV